MVARTRSDPLVKSVSTRIIAGLARQRAAADVGVAVLVSASAAMLGLVLEDLLPVGTTPVTFSAVRWTSLGVLLMLLILAVTYRRWVHHGTGTLYSLSFLDKTMIDYHEQAQADAERRHMRMQLISRRVDVPAREHDGVVDVVQPRQELSRALENAMNQDREDTGYAVAPNLLWPAALAVGAALTRTDKLRFLEYGKKTTVFRLRDNASEPVAIRIDPDHIVTAPTGRRRGVLLPFTPAATTFDIDRRCAESGVSDVVLFGPHSRVQGRRLSGPELGRLADDLARHLADIKNATGDRELVVWAFLPKTVSLLTGWYLSRQRVRFFTGTHLMHYAQSEDRFMALRVHPSQPTSFPPQPMA